MAPRTRATAGTSKSTATQKAAARSKAAAQKAAPIRRTQPSRAAKGKQNVASTGAGGDGDGSDEDEKLPPSKPADKPDRPSKRKRKNNDDDDDDEEDDEPAKPASKKTKRGGKRTAAEHQAVPHDDQVVDEEDEESIVPTGRGGRSRPRAADAHDAQEAEHADATAGPAPGAQGGAAPQVEAADTNEDDDQAAAANEPQAADPNADYDIPDANLTLHEVNALSQTTNPEGRACTFKNHNANLFAILQVHKDIADLSDTDHFRLGYRARFELEHTVAGKQRRDEIGHIEAYRISKRTAARPGASDENWHAHLLRPALGNIREEFSEIARCIRACYTKTGTVKAALRPHNDALTDNSILFIQTIYISPRFQRQGFLPHSLRLFEELLAQLPEYFIFSGTVLLVPGRPEDERGDAWREMGEEEVENALVRAYGRCGFGVWVRNAKVGGDLITVMGRVVPDVDGDAEA